MENKADAFSGEKAFPGQGVLKSENKIFPVPVRAVNLKGIMSLLIQDAVNLREIPFHNLALGMHQPLMRVVDPDENRFMLSIRDGKKKFTIRMTDTAHITLFSS